MKCPTCGAKIGLMSMMSHRKMHKETAGQPAKASSFKCNACGTSFASKSELDGHAKKAHKM